MLQVKDADKAADGLDAIKDCAGEEIGWSIDGDWAVIAETDEIAEEVADDAAKALAGRRRGLHRGGSTRRATRAS